MLPLAIEFAPIHHLNPIWVFESEVGSLLCDLSASVSLVLYTSGQESRW
jgi:hypothetical protein